jgi:ATP-dependent protease HslVU (ClpYQ) peptidase subunit
MTCIIGLLDNNEVYMGCDSLTVAGWDLTVLKNECKVFEKDKFMIGTAGSSRLAQIIQYKFEPPYHKPEVDTKKYMVAEFMEELRKCLKDSEFISKDTQGQVYMDGVAIIGYNGMLFTVDCDFNIMAEGNETAIGCGRNYALGCLFATTGTPEERLTKALEAAANFSAGVCPPFIIKKQGEDNGSKEDN